MNTSICAHRLLHCWLKEDGRSKHVSVKIQKEKKRNLIYDSLIANIHHRVIEKILTAHQIEMPF